MSMLKRANSSGTTRKRVALTGMFLAVVTAASAASLNAYAADEWYDERELLLSCTTDVPGLGTADRCVFEPDSIRKFTSPTAERVSEAKLNCSTSPLTHKMIWSQTTTATVSVELTVEASAGLEGVFNAGVSAKYGESWAHAVTNGGEETLVVGVGEKGWFARAAGMQEVHGKMTINYPKRRHGHFEWYAYPTLTGPSNDITMSKLVARTAPLDENDKALCASSDGASASSSSVPDTATEEVVVREAAAPSAQGNAADGPPSATQ